MDGVPAYEIIVCGDFSEVSREASERLVAIALQVVRDRGSFTLCLSGGSTPRGLYALLATPPYRERMPWKETHVFWGDERCLPWDHPDNHFRMVSDLMFCRVPLPRENIHPVRGAAETPEQAAKDYEGLLRSFFRVGPEDVPRFDLVLLGMGADGHTASLFPGTVALEEDRCLVVAHYVTALCMHRITLTLPVFNRAVQVMFLVSGASKAAALQAVLQGDRGQDKLPARLVRPQEGSVVWLVDREAAAKLLRQQSKPEGGSVR